MRQQFALVLDAKYRCELWLQSTLPTAGSPVSIIADLLERHVREIPEWGHLPAALRLKEEAVARLGVDAAFRELRTALGVPGLDRLRRLPMVPVSQVARAEGAMVAECWPGGESILRASLKTHLAPAAAPIPGRSRAGWLARFDDARIRGRSSLLQVGDRLLQDIEPGEGGFPDHPTYDPGLLHVECGWAWAMDADVPAMRVDEAFWLGGNHTVDFGHWVVEYLPKLMMARDCGLPEGITVLVDAHIPATVRAALPHWLPHGSELVSVPHLAQVEVGRLWCAPTPYYTGFYPLEWSDATWAGRSAAPVPMATLFRHLRQALGDAIAAPTGRPRLYLARKPERSKKKLLNHDAIEALAAQAGFERIYPEDYPLVEQIRLAAHATHLLAPEGSNNLLAFLASPGTKVATLSPPYTYPLGGVGAILAELGVDFEVVVGPDEPTEDGFCAFWNDYRIPPADFAAWLRDWI